MTGDVSPVATCRAAVTHTGSGFLGVAVSSLASPGLLERYRSLRSGVSTRRDRDGFVSGDLLHDDVRLAPTDHRSVREKFAIPPKR
jgi:hypothetical protein